MFDALPPSPPALIVEASSNHQPYLLMGYVATGPENALRCVENISKGSGLKRGRTKNPDGLSEVLVAFLPSGSRAQQLQSYRAAISGTCAGAKIGITVLAISALRNGRGLNEATIEEPSFIMEPKL